MAETIWVGPEGNLVEYLRGIIAAIPIPNEMLLLSFLFSSGSFVFRTHALVRNLVAWKLPNSAQISAPNPGAKQPDAAA